MNPNEIAIVIFVVYGILCFGRFLCLLLDTWESHRAIRRMNQHD